MANNILLEAGTNEMELLVFSLDKTQFGINVAKVREIIQRTQTIPIPYSPDEVEGLFKLRNEVLTLINLGQYFEMVGETTSKGEGSIVVVEFNKIRCGMLVDKVDVIHRLSWDQIEAPSPYLIKLGSPMTGTVNIDDKTVIIVDFETLVSDILGVENAAIPEKNPKGVISRNDIRIILADDSIVIRKSVTKVLQQSGFDNLTICTDGQQLWDVIEERYKDDKSPVDLVLTDIEMPRMDGLHLTHKIKSDNRFKDIPVILFSSLISKDNLNKGLAVGADAQVSKPDSHEMISAIENCLKKRDISIGDEKVVEQV
ncbi:MAG: chemotaxis protein CheV [candidate division Zixibacteria bacterium]|nr:chemotaxis protein CheV [candidate division Zixibacteria bacterium]